MTKVFVAFWNESPGDFLLNSKLGQASVKIFAQENKVDDLRGAV